MNPAALARWMPALSVLAIAGLVAAQHFRLRGRLGHSPVVVGRQAPLSEKVRLGLFLIGCLLLLATSLFPSILDRFPGFLPAPAAAAAGLVLIVLAVALALTAIATLGDEWRLGVDETSEPRLVTSGVYGVMRHPIYTAIMLWLLGLALMTLSSVYLGIAVVGGALAAAQAGREERFLAKVFGGRYGVYAKTAGRFLPRAMEDGLRDLFRKKD